MPELPEVDAIAGVARRHAVGNDITGVEIERWNGKYFSSPSGFHLHKGTTLRVSRVFRIGKQVFFELGPNGFIAVHNAMTGYFDWEHEPWTFDYVEGKRESTESDVRVRFRFTDGNVLRFHDARLFGSMKILAQPPKVLPELISTPHGMPGIPIMGTRFFWEGLRRRVPIKTRLMDQRFCPGVGNIYATESLHLAGIDPRRSSESITPAESSVLYSALRLCLSQSIPQVRYDWLKVYRRTSCVSCQNQVTRVEVGGRSTYFCERCQD